MYTLTAILPQGKLIFKTRYRLERDYPKWIGNTNKDVIPVEFNNLFNLRSFETNVLIYKEKHNIEVKWEKEGVLSSGEIYIP